MLSIFLLIPLSLMLFVVAIWAVRYAVRSNQFEDLDNASQRIILEDRQERRQVIQSHDLVHNDYAREDDAVKDNRPAQSHDIHNTTSKHTASSDEANGMQSQSDADAGSPPKS
ncbi:cbb3-type cytochrome oxidase assembly protein CcoS [uncultured Psychrobacter sp.]|uniref:cbb3-type cytochrome oxidase assembly protein CcoS n=1 Tax=Psychrobacter sp. DM8 TaxID=3440636 RepID=UPI00293D6B6D|nr:cbb3-type cytochrome oxidase assembly protein CcoS [uncultured Psychrobacter sp.]